MPTFVIRLITNLEHTNDPEGLTDMAGRVEGKVAFITGAARGQGRGTRGAAGPGGRRHHRRRHLQADRRGQSRIPPSTPEDLAETADLVKGLNRRIFTAEVDVRDYDALKAAVDSGVEQFGRLDIIVANAGIGNGGETLDKTSEEDWTTMIDINLSGVWKTVKAGVPHLIEGGRGGSIILTSSVGGMKAYPHMRSLHSSQTRRRRSHADLRG